mgnify:CR=1 FL=1
MAAIVVPVGLVVLAADIVGLHGCGFARYTGKAGIQILQMAQTPDIGDTFAAPLLKEGRDAGGLV